MGRRSLIVLDTHCLVWMDQAVERMGVSARHLADAAIVAGDLAVSAISLWEIALLVRKKRLRIRQSLGIWRRDLLQRGVIELPLGGATCMAAAQLDDFHPDPADRLIVATVQELGATLLTADEKILAWPGRLDRRDARI
jgi:PIN domain nuclease of toxin-antitoxin system